MCPDIEVFAPLIHATFGAGELDAADDGDAAARRRCPTCTCASPTARCARPTRCSASSRKLLDLAGGRLTASQVLDLAGRAPVRRRFRLDDDDLARIAQWARDSGVRWGLDAAQRASYRLDRLRRNTWQAGWDRVLVGVAMAEEGQRLFGGVLPLDDVGSGDIDLAGRFAEFLERLHAIVDAFAGPMPLDAWAAAIAEAADSLTAAAGARRGSAFSSAACSRTSSPRPTAGAVATGAGAARDPRAARRPAARPADAGELPHRPPHDLHARPDAVGAAPRRLPDGTRRRRLPAADGARRRRPPRCSIRTSVIATPAARTASCCSTRCWPRPTTW